MGYGKIFQKVFLDKIDHDEDLNLYLGFYGLAFLTLISLLTSFFLKHDFYHNTIIHFIGIFYFFYFKLEKIKIFISIFFIFSFSIPILLISKTHDDFSFYHYPFTNF